VWQIGHLLLSNSALTLSATKAGCKYTAHGKIGTDEPKSFSQEGQHILCQSDHSSGESAGSEAGQGENLWQ